MRIISAQECHEWVQRHIQADFAWETFEANFSSSVIYQLPVETGRKAYMASQVAHAVTSNGVGLLWITDWVFPSTPNMAIFNAFRKSLGDTRDVFDAPGHLFDKADEEQLECMLDLILYFEWDATLINGAATLAVSVSHDEWVSLHAKSDVDLNWLQHSLEGMELKRI